MPTPQGQGPDQRTRLLRAVLLAPLLLVLLLGLLALGQSLQLQAQLGRLQLARSVQQLAPTLRTSYDREALGRQVSRYFLQTARTQGLRRLQLHDSDGNLLLSLGVYDQWRWSGLLGRAMENLVYALSSADGSSAIYDAQHRHVGRADFDFAPAEVRVAQARAVLQLRWTGAALILLALLAAPLLWWWLPRLRGAPAWVQRANPQPQPDRGLDLQAVLRQFRERAGNMLDAMHYALVSADADGRVIYLNKTAEALCGWALPAAGKRMIYSVFHTVSEHEAPMPTALELALQNGADVPMQRGWLRSRHGKRQPIEMMASLIRSPEGAISGVVMMMREISAQLAEVDGLKREARLSKAIVDHLEEGVLITDPAGVVRFANSRAETLFGYSRAELQGFTVTKLMPVPFLNTPSLRITDYVVPPGTAARDERQLPAVVGWRKDATTFPVELWVQTLQDEQGQSLVLMVRDISERLHGEKLAMRLGRLLDAAVEEVYIFDAQSLQLLEVNRSARRNLGFHAEVIARMTPLDLAEDLDEPVFRSYLQQLSSGARDNVVFRCRHRRADGGSYPVEVRLNYSREEEPAVFMAMAIDISERLAAEDRMRDLAHHDALTGLPNRAMLMDRLEQAWLATQRGDRMLGVLVLDVDRLREVNDRYGHVLGDRLLQTVASRLQSALRASDTVARVAEDEFVLLLPGLRSGEDAQLVARKLEETFAEPFVIDGQTLSTSCSIGLNVYPLDDSPPEALLSHAALAMRSAKQIGGGGQRLFLAPIDAARQRQLDLQREVSAALALDELEVMLRPMLREDRVVALHLHLNWRHPRLGRVGHGELMRLAQKAGIAAELELLQLHRAAMLARRLGEAGLRLPSLLVSVSGWQLRGGDFARQAREIIQLHHLPGERLLLGLDLEGVRTLRHLHAPAAALLGEGVRLVLMDALAPLPPPVEMPVQFLLAGAACQGAEAIEALSTIARRRELPLIAAELDQPSSLEAWRGKALAMSGDAIQSKLTLAEAADYLSARQIEPL